MYVFIVRSVRDGASTDPLHAAKSCCGASRSPLLQAAPSTLCIFCTTQISFHTPLKVFQRSHHPMHNGRIWRTLPSPLSNDLIFAAWCAEAQRSGCFLHSEVNSRVTRIGARAYSVQRLIIITSSSGKTQVPFLHTRRSCPHHARTSRPTTRAARNYAVAGTSCISCTCRIPIDLTLANASSGLLYALHGAGT
jgi:hypothetical protein